ncbi:MAG: glycosyltransferase family 4 protein, partial [Planctomycetes bacterium]|nr:glycosyltransferase family 4 protein [Planctomycetota bacterium]
MTKKPIIAHCWYRSANPSGENLVVQRELDLLRAGGCDPATLFRHSDDLLGSRLAQLRAGAQLHASRRRITALRREIEDLDGEVLHVHNPWPLLTYGVFEAAHEAGLPTVQTLHNARLIATNNRFHGSHGQRRPQGADDLLHLRRLASQHGSPLVNALYNRALRAYWKRGVPQGCVDAYICLTEFHRRLMALAGLPDERLVVKPNFLDHRGPIGVEPGDYALFVGRLSPEKGADVLVRTWAGIGLPLKVVGAGPLAGVVAATPGAEYLGPKPQDEVLRLMAGARYLVISSTGYEGFPLVLVEALASGTPCLVPDLGGMPDIIESDRLGLVFTPGDAEDFSSAARELWETAPRMRSACRREYEARYTPSRNLAMLQRIYDNVRNHRRADDGVGQYFDPPRRASSRRVSDGPQDDLALALTPAIGSDNATSNA